jgi:hypothetical protein
MADPDREALADYALEFLKVEDLLERGPAPGGHDEERRAEYRLTLIRQRNELVQKMREARNSDRGGF